MWRRRDNKLSLSSQDVLPFDVQYIYGFNLTSHKHAHFLKGLGEETSNKMAAPRSRSKTRGAHWIKFGGIHEGIVGKATMNKPMNKRV